MNNVNGKKDYIITKKYNSDTFLQEIIAKVDSKTFDIFFEKALRDFIKIFSAPGFRRGKVPRSLVIANQYPNIFNKAVELVAKDVIHSMGELDPKPLDTINIKSVDYTTENSNSKDIIITLTYLPFPKVILADYSKIDYNKPEIRKASKEEVENELINIWYSYAKKTNSSSKKEDFKKEYITEEFCKKSGIYNDANKITNYETLYKYIEDYINNTYIRIAEIESENFIINKVIENTQFINIEGLVNKELDKRLQNYLNKFKEIGVNPEEYLKKNNVNLDDLKNEWRSQVEHEVKLELLLQEYGKQNRLYPSEEEIKNEISKIDTKTKKIYNYDESKMRAVVAYHYLNNRAYTDIINKIKKKQ